MRKLLVITAVNVAILSGCIYLQHAHANDVEDMLVEQDTQQFYAEQRAIQRHEEIMNAIRRQGMNCSTTVGQFVQCDY